MLLQRADLLSALIVLALTAAIASPNSGHHKKRDTTDYYDDGFSHSSSFSSSFNGNGFLSSGDYPGFGFYSRSAFPLFWPWFNFPSIVPWYKGPNVCKDTRYADEPDAFKDMKKGSRTVFTSGSSRQESCEGDGDEYICRGREVVDGKMKMYMTVYECCHGFVRNPKAPGCIEVDVKDLMPALRGMGAVRFVEVSEQAGLDEFLQSGNFTVFCPTNGALDDLLENFDAEKKQIFSQIRRNGNPVNLSEILSSHLTHGFFRLYDFDDEKVVMTAKPGACIRINTYYTPYKVVTANCVPITSENNFARNGIIHRIERVLPIPSRTVADIVASDAQFSKLKALLSRAGLVQFLRNPKGNFTLFAPTDAALASHVSALDILYNESQCISSVINNHILMHVICSSAIPRQAHSLNLIGELLTLTWNANRKLYVDDVQVVVRDIMGTNGVVHIIDGVLIPGQAKSIIQRLEESEIAEFTDLLELADLKSTFDSMRNVTFFIPDDESIRNTPQRVLENILKSREKLKEVLLYHVSIPQVETKEIKSSQTFETMLSNHKVRISQYITYPYLTKQATVQCARILSPDNKICGGVLHVIDRLLLPPKRNIMAALEDMPGLYTVFALLMRTALGDRLRNGDDVFTLLAPTEDAFQKMGSTFSTDIIKDRNKATDLLKMHIFSGTICCEQLRNIYNAGRQQTRSIDGSLLNVRMSSKGEVTVGEAKIVECDISTENGVIHIIDGFVHHFQTETERNIDQVNL